MTEKVVSILDKKESLDLAALVAEDKRARGAKCLEEVNASLKAHNCTVNIFVYIGGQKVPLNAIIGAQVEISLDAQ